ncbi:class I SAM-dependent methyltransferase [Labrys monachus]|uniref:SAM-dependent methyltransferase n=1 Tax=Labrys monachus TaxID=217067 RepID=A0ABU0FLZ7_9HYPH|nr:class I SAM-dependent methyltransferase [Labrys monachus]MDQ0395506.1 SAM-dependent methyltransferase [Labrys monachus]
MAQNIYDTPDFFAGYSRLARSVYGLDGAPEWPSIRALLPDLPGKRVVDLGCGFGWFARWARRQGAAHVLGLDLSENMIGRARAETRDGGIDYVIADLETLQLEEAAFDFAYSSLALHYIEDFGRLVAVVHRALVAGAHFVFTIEHPIFMAPARPGWAVGADGRRTWPVDGYAVEGPRVTDWLAEGVVKQHRRLGTTLNALIAAGFAIRHVEEWSPAPAQLAAQPALADEVERPMMLLVSAQR